jgi:hypothetical protein
MAEIFDTLRKLKQDIFRNIVKPLSLKETFADLDLDGSEEAGFAINQVMNKSGYEFDYQFLYGLAIGYPFEADPFMASRFSDGSFPIWYGSLTKETTMHEVAYHMLKAELTILDINVNVVIKRPRILLDVFCDGLVIDLSHKKSEHPEIISDNYVHSQKIGKFIYDQGFPGFLTPSARHTKGINVNIFKPSLLNNPRITSYLNYHLFPALKKIEIHEGKTVIEEIYF